jgi:hypothetical protein
MSSPARRLAERREHHLFPPTHHQSLRLTRVSTPREQHCRPDRHDLIHRYQRAPTRPLVLSRRRSVVGSELPWPRHLGYFVTLLFNPFPIRAHPCHPWLMIPHSHSRPARLSPDPSQPRGSPKSSRFSPEPVEGAFAVFPALCSLRSLRLNPVPHPALRFLRVLL